jgi:uncharacterized SAM-binding protein YcdF (DUF218 family)
MAALLVEWGVPRTAILVDVRSRTTRENAVEIERILTARGARSLLLITSALHTSPPLWLPAPYSRHRPSRSRFMV